MLQTAKMQLEDKCASLMDKVENMETRQHVSYVKLSNVTGRLNKDKRASRTCVAWLVNTSYL